MSTANKTVQAFIALNTTAVAAASKVFAAIESQSDLWVEALAKAGIMGADIKVYAVIYVAEQSGKMPKPSQRGGLTFDKGTTEYNRVEYLVRVASGAAAVKAANRSSGKVDVVAKLLKAYADLTPAQKRAFKAAI
jgi:hypothetical protein